MSLVSQNTRRLHSLLLDPAEVWVQEVDGKLYATDRYVIVDLAETDTGLAILEQGDQCYQVNKTKVTPTPPVVVMGRNAIKSLLEVNAGHDWTLLHRTPWANLTDGRGGDPVYYRVLTRECDGEPVQVNSDLLYRWEQAFDGASEIKLEHNADRPTSGVIRVSRRHTYRNANYTEQETWRVAGYIQTRAHWAELPGFPQIGNTPLTV